MPEGGDGGGSPVVFISYAHESDALRQDVKELADWLGSRGCTVLTDHAHPYRPPEKGWQTWMQQCIDEADAVLVICTPKLRARYEKNNPVDTGHGGAFEGAIITQRIYDKAMRNDKFFPVLPDGGNKDDIPIILRSWWNTHYFPSRNLGIYRLVCCGPAQKPQAVEQRRDRKKDGSRQERLATKLLASPIVQPFLLALFDEFDEEFEPDTVPQTAADIVRAFACCAANDVQPTFLVVRRALRTALEPVEVDAARRPIEQAATALYCLVASRLVDASVERDGHIVEVPCSEALVCAVIANALFGGELHLQPTDQPDRPSPDCVFVVTKQAGDHQLIDDFERAAYCSIFAKEAATVAIARETGPLTSKQQDRLASELADISRAKRRSLALVVRGFTSPACAGFAHAHQVPVMLPTTRATTALLGMSPDRLIAEIQQLWKMVDVLRRSPDASKDSL